MPRILATKKPTSSVLGLRNNVAVKVYPNGEAVVWRNKVSKIKPAPKRPIGKESDWLWACWQVYLTDGEALKAASLFLGLSLVRNFDKLSKGSIEQFPPVPKAVVRRGLSGITRQGARRVRNAAYLLEKEAGSASLTFATVTIPNLPMQQMAMLHQNWPKFTELYRLAVRRVLQKQGLSGEIVTVSEIQEKRYKKSGVPVLHLHSVFRGRLPYGGWALGTEVHDSIVRNAVIAVCGKVTVSFKSAANLQKVQSSASGYLGKYLSKGAAAVKRLREEGYSGWLPRQWWNCSRSLSSRVDRETIRADDFGEFLLTASVGDQVDIWAFHGTVSLDIGMGEPYWLATYGRLSFNFLAKLKKYVKNEELTQCATL